MLISRKTRQTSLFIFTLLVLFTRLLGYAVSMNKLRRYELLDFGQNCRLEQFGDFVVKRYCGASIGEKSHSEDFWSQAHFSYIRHQESRSNRWECKWLPPGDFAWSVAFAEKLQFQLALHDMGQVGVFPEQLNNWQWLSDLLNKEQQRSIKVLNCFAYTGGSTMACAQYPWVQATHLDASKPAISIAKRNLQSIGMDSSVRWIIDDAVAFMQREIRRGNKYHGIILDPPAYGKFGSKEWVLHRDLFNIMDLLPKLLEHDPSFVLLSCHDLYWTSPRLRTLVESTMSQFSPGIIDHGVMSIKASGLEKYLNLGTFARWHRN
jgi:23S rRNA (cytosine1962-C5)-methyltransferase